MISEDIIEMKNYCTVFPKNDWTYFMISEDISLIGKPHLENSSENEQHLFTRVIQSTEESVLSYSKTFVAKLQQDHQTCM